MSYHVELDGPPPLRVISRKDNDEDACKSILLGNKDDEETLIEAIDLPSLGKINFHCELNGKSSNHHDLDKHQLIHTQCQQDQLKKENLRNSDTLNSTPEVLGNSEQTYLSTKPEIEAHNCSATTKEVESNSPISLPNNDTVLEKSQTTKPVESKQEQVKQSIKSFVCELCGQAFYVKHELMRHMRLHSEENPFSCDVCQKRFSLQASLYNHKKTHDGSGLVQCKICGKILSRMQRLKEHMKLHEEGRSFKCELCGAILKTKHRLERHKKCHKGRTCKFCGVEFAGLKLLERHISSKHKEKETVKCKECGKDFTSEAKLRKHLVSHYGSKCMHCEEVFKTDYLLNKHVKFVHTRNVKQCNICKKEYTTKYLLDIHLRSHTGERPFKCNQCEKGFFEKSALSKHLMFHSDARPYQCTVCQKAFRQKESLDIHLLKHQNGGFHQCNKCGESFELKSRLKKHQLDVHTHCYDCTQKCGKRFTTRKKMLYHLRRDHGVKRPFSCQHCGRSYECKSILERHVKIHYDVDRYECEICKKKFTQKCGLLIHCLKQGIEKAYGCSSCGLHFELDSELQEHLKVINDGYQCDICNHHFKDNCNLSKHMKLHSVKPSVKINKFCFICEKYVSNLKEHMKRVHNYVPFKCDICAKEYKDGRALQKHLQKGHKFQCNYCEDLFFPSMKLLIEHKRIQHRNEKYPCLHCKERFASSFLCTEHMQREHRNNLFKCEYCSKEFNSRKRLVQHVKIHALQKLFQCEFCNKQFHSKTILQSHLLVHTRSLIFQCSDCLRKFRTESSLNSHLCPCDDQLFKCVVCSKFYRSELSLQKHIKLHNVKLSHCSYCKMNFISVKRLTAHMKQCLYENCDICDKRFHITELKNHRENCTPIISNNKNKPNYLCEPCMKDIYSYDLVLEHLYETHSDERPVRCTHCAQELNSRRCWNSHILKHLSDSPFVCTTCGKCFSQKNLFERHIKGHEYSARTINEKLNRLKDVSTANDNLNDEILLDAEQIDLMSNFNLSTTSAILNYQDVKIPSSKIKRKFFHCRPCKVKFFTYSSVLSHLYKKHSLDVPIKCTHCKEEFNQRTCWKKHILKHLGARPFFCPLCGDAFKTNSFLIRHIQKFHMKISSLQQSDKCVEDDNDYHSDAKDSTSDENIYLENSFKETTSGQGLLDNCGTNSGNETNSCSVNSSDLETTSNRENNSSLESNSRPTDLRISPRKNKNNLKLTIKKNDKDNSAKQYLRKLKMEVKRNQISIPVKKRGRRNSTVKTDSEINMLKRKSNAKQNQLKQNETDYESDKSIPLVKNRGRRKSTVKTDSEINTQKRKSNAKQNHLKQNETDYESDKSISPVKKRGRRKSTVETDSDINTQKGKSNGKQKHLKQIETDYESDKSIPPVKKRGRRKSTVETDSEINMLKRKSNAKQKHLKQNETDYESDKSIPPVKKRGRRKSTVETDSEINMLKRKSNAKQKHLKQNETDYESDKSIPVKKRGRRKSTVETDSEINTKKGKSNAKQKHLKQNDTDYESDKSIPPVKKRGRRKSTVETASDINTQKGKSNAKQKHLKQIETDYESDKSIPPVKKRGRRKSTVETDVDINTQKRKSNVKGKQKTKSNVKQKNLKHNETDDECDKSVPSVKKRGRQKSTEGVDQENNTQDDFAVELSDKKKGSKSNSITKRFNLSAKKRGCGRKGYTTSQSKISKSLFQSKKSKSHVISEKLKPNEKGIGKITSSVRQRRNQHYTDCSIDIDFNIIPNKDFSIEGKNGLNEQSKLDNNQSQNVDERAGDDFDEDENRKDDVKVLQDGTEIYECEICKKVYQNKNSLRAHKYTHQINCPFECPFADGCSFSMRFLLKRHIKDNHLRHGDPMSPDDQERIMKSDYCRKIVKELLEAKKLKLDEKDFKEIKSLQILENLLKDEIIENDDKAKTGEAKSWSCDVCNKVFRNKNYLKNHKQLHNRDISYKCEHCGKTFATLRYLTLHKRRGHRITVAMREKKIKDDYLVSDLQIENVEMYECNHCKERFSTGSNLLTHIATVHSFKPFDDIDDNKEEQRLHSHVTSDKIAQDVSSNPTDGGPTSCIICNQQFSTTNLLKLHEQCYHSNTDSSPETIMVICSICHQQVSIQQLQMHMDSAHGKTQVKRDMFGREYDDTGGCKKIAMKNPATTPSLNVLNILSKVDLGKNKVVPNTIYSISNPANIPSMNVLNVLSEGKLGSNKIISDTIHSISNDTHVLSCEKKSNSVDQVISTSNAPKIIVIKNNDEPYNSMNIDQTIVNSEPSKDNEKIKTYVGSKDINESGFPETNSDDTVTPFGEKKESPKVKKPLKLNQCCVCGKILGNIYTLQKHKLLHERPYQCQYCNFGYFSAERLEKHVKSHYRKLFKKNKIKQVISFPKDSYVKAVSNSNTELPLKDNLTILASKEPTTCFILKDSVLSSFATIVLSTSNSDNKQKPPKDPVTIDTSNTNSVHPVTEEVDPGPPPLAIIQSSVVQDLCSEGNFSKSECKASEEIVNKGECSNMSAVSFKDHESINPTQCNMCGKIYVTKYNLKRHLKEVHNKSFNGNDSENTSAKERLDKYLQSHDDSSLSKGETKSLSSANKDINVEDSCKIDLTCLELPLTDSPSYIPNSGALDVSDSSPLPPLRPIKSNMKDISPSVASESFQKSTSFDSVAGVLFQCGVCTKVFDKLDKLKEHMLKHND